MFTSDNTMDEKKTRIPDMSDAEFVSFLYAERDRENSLSQYQGWNNWALIGAIITLLSVAYATLIGNARIDWMRVSYYASGTIAFFLAYHSWLNFFKRERGHDFTRVRLLKEMTPWVDSGLAISTAIAAIVLILVLDCPSYVFWTWIVVLTVQIAVLVIALINRNRLVPFYFYRPFFTRLWLNIVYDGFAGGLFAWGWSCSFKKASWCILNPEFEVGVCLGAVTVLAYFLIRIKVENKVVEQFDAITDMYLYTDTSKEETYQAILCNRMGYGIWEVCKKDLSKVQEMSDACEKKTQKLQELKAMIQSGEYDINQIPSYHKRMKSILMYLNESIRQSERLANRLNEMVKTAPVLNQIAAINTVFDTNHELYQRVSEAQKEVDVASTLLEKEFDKYYCQKSNMLCAKLCCEHRNDPMEKKYARKLRWRRFLIRIHPKNKGGTGVDA